MLDEKRLHALLPQVYEAAVRPDLWPPVLHSLAEHLAGTACALAVHHFGLREGTIYKAWGYDPDFVSSYVEHFAPLNVWLHQEARYRPTGAISIGHQLVADAELIGSEFYRDWLEPQGLHHRLCGVVLREAGSVVYLAAMRPRHHAPFGADEMARLRPLLGHLEQAVRLHRRLTLLESERNEAKHALDLLPTGILFVGDNGEILMANRRAREILEAGEGLIVRRGRMQAEDREESERLRAMIAGAAQTARGRGTQAGGAMAVSRRSRVRSLSVLISPMRTSHPMLGEERAAAAVFVIDPEQRVNVDEKRLCQLYGLTPVEARLAWRIAEGKSVDEAAATVRLTVNSARTYLRRIFGKMGVQRQAELVRLLLVGPAQLRRDAPFLRDGPAP